MLSVIIILDTFICVTYRLLDELAAESGLHQISLEDVPIELMIWMTVKYKIDFRYETEKSTT